MYQFLSTITLTHLCLSETCKNSSDKGKTDSNQRRRGGNGGKKGEGGQGTCIKDPWTEPKGSRIEGGR